MKTTRKTKCLPLYGGVQVKIKKEKLKLKNSHYITIASTTGTLPPHSSCLLLTHTLSLSLSVRITRH